MTEKNLRTTVILVGKDTHGKRYPSLPACLQRETQSEGLQIIFIRDLHILARIQDDLGQNIYSRDLKVNPCLGVFQHKRSSKSDPVEQHPPKNLILESLMPPTPRGNCTGALKVAL